MSLADVLREPVPAMPTLPPLRLASVADSLATRWGQAAEPPAGLDLDAVVERFAAALAEGSAALTRVGPDNWRALPWALWHQDARLARQPAMLDALAARVREAPRRGLAAALIGAYLRAFSPGLPGLEQVASLLAEQVDRRYWPWRDRA